MFETSTSVSTLLAVGTILYVSGYFYYITGSVFEDTRPNRWSWLIWSTAMSIEVATFDALVEDPIKVFLLQISAGLCILSTCVVWMRSEFRWPDITEWICLIVSTVAIVVWLKLEMTHFAHLLMVASIPVGFIPTWKDVLNGKGNEKNPAWGLWTVADIVAVVVIFISSDEVTVAEEMPYMTMEIICHGSIWLMVGISSITKLKVKLKRT